MLSPACPPTPPPRSQGPARDQPGPFTSLGTAERGLAGEEGATRTVPSGGGGL